ncbi:Uncharacterised protein [Mycobacteroides abscessus subsp. abscessus]|nr:Uncharacterised protein [Mycobacteroides abscessus subsp. abscessus]
MPHVIWNRGTEFPGPKASLPPRSAHATTGKICNPLARNQLRFSPAAKSTYACAH